MMMVVMVRRKKVAMILMNQNKTALVTKSIEDIPDKTAQNKTKMEKRTKNSHQDQKILSNDKEILLYYKVVQFYRKHYRKKCKQVMKREVHFSE